MVIPCFNEQEVLPLTAPLFLEELMHLADSGKISASSKILFVDDGSKDRTWNIIRQLADGDIHFAGISLSRNQGHQNALLAGLMEAKAHCDITISIDCDGQDDIHVMGEMVDAYLDGAEVVYGVRSNRETDSRFKRASAHGFYRFMNFMGAEVIYDHSDYRLISSKVLDHLADFEEVNIFLRGMIPLVGFKSTSVCYERKERAAGKSHYPLRKMFSLAFDAITSFSAKPITLIAQLGFVVSILGFLGIIWAFIAVITGHAVTGWASTICIICFLGGIQILSLGIIGEYVGKTYLEAKHRPRYIVSEKTYEE